MGESKKRKTYVGRVVSDKMDKTVVLAVSRRVAHTKYTKTISRTTKFKAHDEENAKKIGDNVSIEETRPISKDKKFKVVA